MDERGHLVFAVTRTDGEVLYGEYFEVGMPENDNHFQYIEVGAFGFTYRENAGNPYPSARKRFPAEEGVTAEQLIRNFFSKPDVVMKKWQHTPGVEFLGGVTFRPDWIIEDSSEA